MFRARTAGPASTVDQDARPVRGSRRRTGGRGFATGAGLFARVVRLVVTVVVAIIVAGILLVVLKASPSNAIVSPVHDWARSLAGAGAA